MAAVSAAIAASISAIPLSTTTAGTLHRRSVFTRASSSPAPSPAAPRKFDITFGAGRSADALQESPAEGRPAPMLHASNAILCSNLAKPSVTNFEKSKCNDKEKIGFSASIISSAPKCYLNNNNTTGRAFIKHQSFISSSSSMDLLENKPLVKMCGITSPEDAALACKAGADLIGMIIWPNSKRSVSLLVAKEITKVAKEYGAEAVGVFVDDDVPTILRALEVVGLDYMQLHGEASRAGYSMLRQHGRIIYVLHAAENGELLNTVSLDESCLADWILVDSKTGGSGKGFNWSNFRLPDLSSKNGWLLAGGINTQNVCEAIAALKPNGVDVSSGICGHDGIKKDSNKILSFMSKIRPTGQIS